MSVPFSRVGLAAALLSLALAGCGGQDEVGQDSAGSGPPTPEELAAALVAPDDLGPGWSVTRMPDSEIDETGVVSEEDAAMLPQVQFCEKAGDAAVQAAEDLRWHAFRQVELDTGAPTEPPSPGAPPVHHLVFVQEFLTSGAEDEMTTTYAGLVAGNAACLGKQTAPDGETVRTTRLDVPDLGDSSYGWRDLATEPGPPANRAVWNLRQVLVRDGEVLMMATIAEIASPGVTTVIDDAEAASIMTTMADELP
jgi:hypothetical protein